MNIVLQCTRMCYFCFFFSSRRRHTRCTLVTGVQTCALPISNFDAQRRERGQPTVSELDGADRFSVATHMRGDVAAPVIYTATALDYLSIDRDKFDVVAALGNSMGWYSALACAGAVSVEDGFRKIGRAHV